MIRGCCVIADVEGNRGAFSPRAAVQIPAEFAGVLTALSDDLLLAQDCERLFGAIPLPVAKAILRNLEPARAALDLAVKAAEGPVC